MFAVIWAVCTVANAEDPAFSTPAAEVVKEAETHLTGEVGATYATGNSNFYAVNGLTTFSYKAGRNKVSAVGGVNLGGAVVDADGDGVVSDVERDGGFSPTAKRLFADVRYDRFLSERDSLYALAGVFSDQFAGYDLRAHEQLGYSRLLTKGDKGEARAELGVDWAQEYYIDGADPASSVEFVAARVLLAGVYKPNASVSLAETLEVYENVLDTADLRILNTASITSSVAKNLSLKLSHVLIYDNVPVPGFRPLDQTTMVTIVVTLI